MRPQPLLVALLASLAFAAPSTAAPRPQITDATGDQVPVGGAGYDVVSAAFSTTGDKYKVGRKTVYNPTKLIVTVTYAGAVASDAHAAQVVSFDAPGCENIYMQRYSGGTWAFSGCIDDFAFAVKASGKTLTFTLPFKAIGTKSLKKGAVLTDLRTYTSVADPVLGYESGELVGAFGAGPVDNAATTAPYRIS